MVGKWSGLMFRTFSILLLLGAGVAIAADPTSGSGGSGTPAGGVESDLDKAATASPAEMRKFAEEAARKVNEHNKAVKKMTADAQNQSDADLLSCLIPKSTSLQALEQVTATSRTSLNAALDDFNEQNEKVARYHYRLIAVSLNRAFSIRQAAENCDTRSTFDGGKSTIDIEGGIGDDDDTIDSDELDDMWIGFDPPPLTQFIP